jgi:F420-dependent oxidoreductase-like protein
MKISTGLGGTSRSSEEESGLLREIDYLGQVKRLGVDIVWAAEAWGADGVAPLAFLAARAPGLTFGTSILQISARTPVVTAMTAMTMATLTGNRFILGLGVSGPQVVEGLHSQKFDHPLGRLREYIQILRLAFTGQKLEFQGRHYQLPVPSGQGKAIRLGQVANPGIPIHLATLGPKMLELTGELADGWLGNAFTPEAAHVYFDRLKAGAARAGRSLDNFDVKIAVACGIADDPGPLIAAQKTSLAFTLGGMGSAKTNFYNEAFRRIGFEDAAIEVQALFVQGRREEAANRVPDDMALRTSLIGAEAMIRERIGKYRDAGVTILHLNPVGATYAERLEQIGRVSELIRQECGG